MNRMFTAAVPRVLLLEDDPVSRAFLGEALTGLPASVDYAETCAGAESMARNGPHALWLFDANLPDGNGADLLVRLRASGLSTPAVALTAESLPERLAALSMAGYIEVLQKPIGIAALQMAVRRLLGDGSFTGPAPTHGPVLWDENRALLAVGGNTESAKALRQLFLQELPKQLESLREAFANCEHAIVRDHLHRLKASCGFVGAERLLSTVNHLSAEMSESRFREFLEVAGDQQRTATITPGAA